MSSSSIVEGRFAPGTLLAQRYRIVGILGQGGMGEVYRADDLKLGQPVALKFLPVSIANNEIALDRFHGEVRIARQVAHPCVCRVYDIGEADGMPFISMEYVDGEDLRSLLRRIGRLPPDKAVEIGRRLCAGLAAAHERGVLHRDLKPANIMIDGRGEVRITDFGLAGLVGEFQGAEVSNGTPLYMAPEQLSGKEVTVASDIYALGLVLYEICTGKRAFEADSIEGLKRLRESSTITNPSVLTKDLDPSVERVILRCLDPDPRRRPSSALAVAAGLPGGDPLAAALAAGETPSPELVAAAGETEGMRVGLAAACLAFLVVAWAGALYLASNLSVFKGISMQSPEALAQKARDTLDRLGYANRADDAFGFDLDYINYLRKTGKDGVARAGSLYKPPPVVFWYRQSPRSLSPTTATMGSLSQLVVTPDDPPPVLSGMAIAELDPQGRLIHLDAVPPQLAEPKTSPVQFDWSSLFEAAGLHLADFSTAEPKWNSIGASDARAAWVSSRDQSLRVEAAAWQGKPVYFQVIGPWTQPDRMLTAETTSPRTRLLASLFVLLLLGAMPLAYRNFRAEKGDRRGALRLATFVFTARMLFWVVDGDHVWALSELGLFILAASFALFMAVVVWVIYLALEPFVRKRWPHAIISWVRLLAGHIRDPLVGRDVLAGVGLGAILLLGQLLRQVISPQYRLSALTLQSTDTLLGMRHALGALLYYSWYEPAMALLLFLMMFLIRALVRRGWLAALIFVAVFALPLLQEHPPLGIIIVQLLTSGLFATVLLQMGPLPVAVALITDNLLLTLPVTTDTSAWYFYLTVFGVLCLAAVTVYAFHTALGGRTLFKADLLEA
jgi:tRNA A-37 threonylcarbamoyl transferase component Bud32